MNRKDLVNATVAAALGMSLMSIATNATAVENEKCYGVSKAGKNDCAANGHPCAGQAPKDADPNEWVFVPKGTCEKLVNGKTQ